jgi:hypothetical protein
MARMVGLWMILIAVVVVVAAITMAVKGWHRLDQVPDAPRTDAPRTDAPRTDASHAGPKKRA